MHPKIVAIVLIVAVTLSACSVWRTRDEFTIRDRMGNDYRVVKMPDGNYWTTQNINLDMPGSFCYDSLETNCMRYGKLYTWKTAMAVCGELGKGWHLPGTDEWRGLAKQFGGAFGDSNDSGKGAYTALMIEGNSRFDAKLGGGRDLQGGFGRLEAHGFYWMATEVNDSTAWFSNFGKGRPALYLQDNGEKQRAFAVRCVKDN